MFVRLLVVVCVTLVALVGAGQLNALDKIAVLLAQLDAKDQQLEAKDQQLEAKVQQLEAKVQQLKDKDLQLDAKDQQFEAGLELIDTRVTIVSGEEGNGDPKCSKVCAGTTGRDTTSWGDYNLNKIYTVVDISSCGFVKIPTITTSLEGHGYHSIMGTSVMGTSFIYGATTTGFQVLLTSDVFDVNTSYAAAGQWNVEWVAVGFTC